MREIQVNIELVKLGDEGYHAFCKGKINGKKARILIDTGASKSVVAESFAQALELNEHVELEDASTAGINPGGIEANFLKLRTLRFKKLRIKNLVVGSIDVTHVQQLYSEMEIKPFDFILGGEVLERCAAVLDYGQKTLTFHTEALKLAF